MSIAAELTVKMYEARDAMKSVLRDKYKAKIGQCKIQILDEMAATKTDVLPACISLVKRIQSNGAPEIVKAMMFSACIEIIEGFENGYKTHDQKWRDAFIMPIAQQMQKRGIKEVHISMLPDGKATFELIPIK